MSEQPKPRKLLDQVRDALRVKHYSIRTEQAYVAWIRRFILFHDKRHPATMGAAEIEAFLTHLAVDSNVAASTQNQALSALLFLYCEVLCQDPGAIDAVRAKKPKRLPTVLTREEVERVLAGLSGTNQLIARLLYGSGLRLIECLRLRVKDLDFAYRQIVVRDGKGQKDRVTVLPAKLVDSLHEHLQRVAMIHQQDLDQGHGAVYLPHALEVKYPSANQEWCWQYVFPARSLSVDPRSGILRRHHLGESGPQRAVRANRGCERVIVCLGVMANHLDTLFDQPMPGGGNQTGGIPKILLVIAILLVPAGVDDHNITRLDLGLGLWLGRRNMIPRRHVG